MNQSHDDPVGLPGGRAERENDEIELIDPVTAELLLNTNPLVEEALIVAEASATTSNKWLDLVGSLAVALTGIGLLVYSYNYPEPQIVFDSVGPMGFPIAIGIFLLAGGAVQSVRTISFMAKFGSLGAEEGTEDEPGHEVSKWRALIIMAGCFLYFFLLGYVGFLVLTPIALTAGLWAMKYRNWLWRGIVAILFTLVSFILFNSVLGVPLPQGFLTEVLLDLNVIRI